MYACASHSMRRGVRVYVAAHRTGAAATRRPRRRGHGTHTCTRAPPTACDVVCVCVWQLIWLVSQQRGDLGDAVATLKHVRVRLAQHATWCACVCGSSPDRCRSNTATSATRSRHSHMYACASHSMRLGVRVCVAAHLAGVAATRRPRRRGRGTHACTRAPPTACDVVCVCVWQLTWLVSQQRGDLGDAVTALAHVGVRLPQHATWCACECGSSPG
ncbi:unnamed protein product [Parnassius apollo]|uniref:(apollo) hypothetical protein n=1 Tax=Parnassius apollo TaxID=110799 RepID=A0A8S3W9Q8_PARAO|nr:unnamed protein product [Parnassius apollo]